MSLNTDAITTNTPDRFATLKAKIAHMQEVIEGKYNPDETKQKIATLEESIRKMCESLIKEKAILFSHFRLSDYALPKFDFEITDAELKPLLETAFEAFPQGANGTELADFIADYRVNSQRIAKFQEDTCLLVRSGTGLETNYRLATPDETKAMKADEEAQAAEDAAKAIEEAARAAAASTKKAKAKGKRKSR